jgi:nucleoid-associated protein YgaU
VTKSLKLLIAVALLAGGYGLALVWNASADFFWPSPVSLSSDGEYAAPTLGPNVTAAAGGTSGVQLVPLSQAGQAIGLSALGSVAIGKNANDAANRLPPTQNPTWLSAGPPAKMVSVATSSGVPTDQPIPHGTPAADSSSDSLVTPSDPRDMPTATPFPSARITAVKPVQDSPSADASPWDRWPRWEPATAATPSVTPAVAAEASGAPNNQVVTASMPQSDSKLPNPAAFQATFISSEPSAASGDPPNRLVPVAPPLAQSDDEEGEPRTHTIVDGDSLAKLAERFLGDPQLGDRIYQLNRGVLSSPDLLPIGAEVELPPRPSIAANCAAPLPSAAKPAPANPPGLVPVEDVRKAFVGMPRAQLLRPLPPTDESKPAGTMPAYAASGR